MATREAQQQRSVAADRDQERRGLDRRAVGCDAERVALVGAQSDAESGLAEDCRRRERRRRGRGRARGRRKGRRFALLCSVFMRSRCLRQPHRRFVRRPPVRPRNASIQQELAVPRRSPAAATLRSGSAAKTERPAAASATSCTIARCTNGSRTTPPLPIRSRPTSNCGLTSATTTPCGSQICARPGEDRAERNERRIDDDQIEPLGKRIAGQAAEIGSLAHVHSRIAAQSPIELAVADVDGPVTWAAPC